jgi:hypothetical protein
MPFLECKAGSKILPSEMRHVVIIINPSENIYVGHGLLLRKYV